ncbi:hypothetical protein N7478_005991 [Penicillium angulare]|uniref:uncharacterized protein n=1 Tax=Penicillium angulare TaxID=116970 RepID=UPI00253FD841|nr:uncharacterized protein N7478_005991 [Penicillium angulare]KAJ5280619.1 hypothetical protein N7478_005991 [Penicillium angulare]
MASDLLRPLAVFCSHADSQRYIKNIRNLGDAWRSLAEQPIPECDKHSIVAETTFDFTLKLIDSPKEQSQSSQAAIEMLTTESNLSTSSAHYSRPTGRPRHYRIFADYGTDFI